MDTDQTAGVRGTFLNSKDIFQIHDRLTFKVLSVKFMFMHILIMENGILKEVGSNESDVFACLSTISFPWIPRNPTENNFFIS